MKNSCLRVDNLQREGNTLIRIEHFQHLASDSFNFLGFIDQFCQCIARFLRQLELAKMIDKCQPIECLAARLFDFIEEGLSPNCLDRTSAELWLVSVAEMGHASRSQNSSHFEMYYTITRHQIRHLIYYFLSEKIL